MSEESTASPSTTGESFYPEVTSLFNCNYDLEFKEVCLEQNSMSFLHKNLVNLYIIYELDTWSNDLNADFTRGSCLNGSLKLT